MQLTLTINPLDISEVNKALALLGRQRDALITGGEQPAAAAPAAEKPKAEKPKAEKPAPAPAPVEQPPQQPAAEAPQPAAAEQPALDYKADVQPRILKLAGKDRDACVKLLAKFGVANGTALKPEQFADVVAAFDAALEG